MADDTPTMSDDPHMLSNEPSVPPTEDVAGQEPDASAAPDPGPASTRDEAENRPEDPYATPPDPHEGAVPPGYDWPTHGGYLGCLLGLVAACTLSGFLGGTWFAILATPSWVKLTITLVIALAAFVGLGRLGWVLGKRFYREYPQPTRGQPAAAPLADGAPRPGDGPHA